jgi:hypothetical protein
MDADRSRLSFLGRRLPPLFERRVVEHGQIELECLDGSRHCFGRGDVLWLDPLPLRALHNRGVRRAGRRFAATCQG